MNVKLIRMSSGEDVVATIVNETDSVLEVENAIVAIPTGEGQIGFAPWSPLVSKSEKTLPVNKKFVVYIAEVAEDIVNQYNQMFSKIVTPTSKLVYK
jgi:hypothetical protein